MTPVCCVPSYDCMTQCVLHDIVTRIKRRGKSALWLARETACQVFARGARGLETRRKVKAR